MMGLLRILLTEIPRESLARQCEQTATCAAASLYQETVRFSDARSAFRKLGNGLEGVGPNRAWKDTFWKIIDRHITPAATR